MGKKKVEVVLKDLENDFDQFAKELPIQSQNEFDKLVNNTHDRHYQILYNYEKELDYNGFDFSSFSLQFKEMKEKLITQNEEVISDLRGEEISQIKKLVEEFKNLFNEQITKIEIDSDSNGNFIAKDIQNVQDEILGMFSDKCDSFTYIEDYSKFIDNLEFSLEKLKNNKIKKHQEHKIQLQREMISVSKMKNQQAIEKLEKQRKMHEEQKIQLEKQLEKQK